MSHMGDLALAILQLRDVAQEGGDLHPIVSARLRERHLHRKGRSVPVKGRQFETGPADVRARPAREIACHAFGMARPHRLGDDDLGHGATTNLGRRPAEDCFGRRVPLDDGAVEIDSDEGVLGDLQNSAVGRLDLARRSPLQIRPFGNEPGQIGQTLLLVRRELTVGRVEQAEAPDLRLARHGNRRAGEKTDLFLWPRVLRATASSHCAASAKPRADLALGLRFWMVRSVSDFEEGQGRIIEDQTDDRRPKRPRGDPAKRFEAVDCRMYPKPCTAWHRRTK